MKPNWTFPTIISVAFTLLFITACDEAKLIDENKDLPAQEWFYKNRLVFDVNIEDTNKTYNVYLNLRVGNDYKYNNFFVMVHQTSPSQTVTKERKEIVLIDESGNWLGKGLGDLYDYQVPIYPQYRFKEKGIYHFELEQNMREDTLTHLYAAGMRIEDFSIARQ
jgi:gliding motility-associated lipoprotein GldH